MTMLIHSVWNGCKDTAYDKYIQTILYNVCDIADNTSTRKRGTSK